MYQDNLGVLWLSTDQGLIRYDGNNTDIFSRHEKKGSFGPASNDIKGFSQGKLNTLWLATTEGLSQLNLSTWQFKHYLTGVESRDAYVNNVVYDVFKDSKEQIWAATSRGIFLYNQTKDVFEGFTPWHPEYAFNGLQVWVQTITEDSKGILWLGTSAGGLIEFDPISGVFKHFSSHSDNPNQFVTDFVYAIHIASTTELLLGTEIGLVRFNTLTHKSEVVLQDVIKQRVRDIIQDNEGNWLLRTDGQVFKVNKDYEQAIVMAPNRFDFVGSSFPTPEFLFKDHEETIWTSYFGIGLHRLTAKAYKVQTVALDKNIQRENEANIIDYVELNGRSFVTSQFGLMGVTSDTIGKKIKLENNLAGLGPFYGLHVGPDNNLYVGRNSGVSILNTHDQIQHVTIDFQGTLPVRQVVVDKENTIWGLAYGVEFIGVNKNLSFLKEEQKKFGGLKQNAKFIEISDDRDNVFILYDDQGLFTFDLKTNQFIYVENTANTRGYINMQRLNNNSLLLMDGSKRAIQVDMESLATSSFDLPMDQIKCVVLQDGRIQWAAHKKGSLYQLDNKSDKYSLIKEYEGLEKSGVTSNVCIINQYGEALFSSINGLKKVVNTHHFRKVPNTKTIITHVSTKHGTERVNIAPSDIVDMQSTTLAHDEFPVLIKFSALSFLDRSQIKYKYKITGLSESWQTINEAQLSINHLPPGEFIIEVKGSSSEGVWGDNSSKIKVIVLPPLWMSWWAKIIYVLLFLLSAYSWSLIRTHQIQRKAAELEALVQNRTHQLAAEKSKVERLLNQKNNEFANVSHEFRTPLTLILGPLQQLLRAKIRNSTRQKLEVMHRSAVRLLRMVDQLLHLEKFKVNREAQSQPVAIKPMICAMVESFQPIAKEKNITLSIGQVDDVYVLFKEDALETVMLNLLSNAFKYTPRYGDIEVYTICKSDELVRICVQDSGIGIEESQHMSIFERFSRVTNENTSQIEGAGIGLALVKEFVEAHEGYVNVDSQLGTGALFQVDLKRTVLTALEVNSLKINTDLLNMEIDNLKQSQDSFDDLPKVMSMQHNEGLDVPRLLIIEDNSDMRSYILDSLQSRFNINECADGAQGIAQAIKSIPDLVICDITMPKMDGYQVVEVLKNDERTSHIPIILLTARSDKESRLRGWREQADEFITKPFDQEELNVRVDNLLSIRQLLKSRFESQEIGLKPTNIQEKAGLNEKERSFLQKINECCEQHYTNAGFETAIIASHLAMSERQFQRKLKALLNKSPTEYLRSFRLNKAKKRLVEVDYVTQVAYEVGFSSQSYFAKCFKAQFGMTAKEYQHTK